MPDASGLRHHIDAQIGTRRPDAAIAGLAAGQFLDAYGVPRPRINATVDLWPKSREVDCVWPGRRLVAELDGCATHGTRGAFEDDRVLPVAGYRVIRIAWRHPIEDGPVLGAQIRALLA